MAENIHSILATRDGERAWVQDIHRLIRAQQFDAAETRLFACLSGERHHPIAEAALAMSLDQLSFRDWDRLNRFVSRPVYRLDRPAAAIGLDFSNYGDSLSGDPSVEVLAYCDRPGASFHFSAASREEFLSASEEGVAVWQGEFDDAVGILLDGFAPFNSLLVEYRRGGAERKRGTDGYPAFVLASLVEGLRYHQLVVRALAADGLPRRLPVLVGGHGEPYVAISVYYPETIVAPDTRTEAEVLRERRRGRVASPEAVEAGLRQMLGEKRGPLVDLGVSILANFLVESSRNRKQRRRSERSP